MTTEQLIKKYKTFIGNIEWHIKTNNPEGQDLNACNNQLRYFYEILNDLSTLESLPDAGAEVVALKKLKLIICQMIDAGGDPDLHSVLTHISELENKPNYWDKYIDDANDYQKGFEAGAASQPKAAAPKQHVPSDFKDITGWGTVEENTAYELGRKHEQKVIIDFIEKWDGKNNSQLGQILHDKLAAAPTQEKENNY